MDIFRPTDASYKADELRAAVERLEARTMENSYKSANSPPINGASA